METQDTAVALLSICDHFDPRFGMITQADSGEAEGYQPGKPASSGICGKLGSRWDFSGPVLAPGSARPPIGDFFTGPSWNINAKPLT